MALSGIKCISFDGDGTLWDFEKVMRHSNRLVLAELIRLAPEKGRRLTVEKMIEIRNQVSEQLKGKMFRLEDIRLEAFKETLKFIEMPDDRLAVHLNDLYLKHRFEDIELYSEVALTLNSLKKRFTLGLVSNGNGYPEKCGLAGMFQFVVFSQDYGFEKSDPRLFKVAQAKSGCTGEEIVHIGDSLQNDYLGARNAGLKSIWLNRTNAQPSPGVTPEYTVQELSQLLNIIL
jgi:HAD superfamily hydrolase (TIGR01509 family)